MKLSNLLARLLGKSSIQDKSYRTSPNNATPVYNIYVVPESGVPQSLLARDFFRENFAGTLERCTGEFYVLDTGEVVKGKVHGLRIFKAELGITGNGKASDLHFPVADFRKYVIDCFEEREGRLFLQTVRQDYGTPNREKPHYEKAA